jgi:hypothetical protein
MMSTPESQATPENQPPTNLPVTSKSRTVHKRDKKRKKKKDESSAHGPRGFRNDFMIGQEFQKMKDYNAGERDALREQIKKLEDDLSAVKTPDLTQASSEKPSDGPDLGSIIPLNGLTYHHKKIHSVDEAHYQKQVKKFVDGSSYKILFALLGCEYLVLKLLQLTTAAIVAALIAIILLHYSIVESAIVPLLIIESYVFSCYCVLNMFARVQFWWRWRKFMMKKEEKYLRNNLIACHSLSPVKVKYHYHLDGQLAPPVSWDARTDAAACAKLTQADPWLATCIETRSYKPQDKFVLPTFHWNPILILVNAVWTAFQPKKRRVIVKKNIRVSVQLLVQLMDIGNAMPNADDITTYGRLCMAARNNRGVNINKLDSLHDSVCQNTVIVAYAWWRHHASKWARPFEPTPAP